LSSKRKIKIKRSQASPAPTGAGVAGDLGGAGCAVIAVGAAERSEAAIFALTLEFQAKDQDQKIAGFASSYMCRCCW
jgi:hypothetical protein